MLEDVKFYEDKNYKKEYTQFLSQYNLEIVGDKARVHCISVFGDNKSRLNKLHILGSNNEFKHVSLMVNGKKTYFKIPR